MSPASAKAKRRDSSKIFAVPQTEQSSCVLLNKMLQVGLAEVLRERGVFETSYFSQKSINGTIVNVLDTQRDESAKAIGDWLKGIEHALFRNYLRAVTFVLDNCEKAIVDSVPREAYKFSLLRLPNGHSLFVIGAQSGASQCLTPRTKQQIASDFEQAIIQMLDSLRRMAAQQSRTPLPDRLCITAQLDFEKDVPGDYEPPFFERGSNTIKLEGLRQTLHGLVNSGFHKFASKSYVPPNETSADLSTCEDENHIDEANESKSQDEHANTNKCTQQRFADVHADRSDETIRSHDNHANVGYEISCDITAGDSISTVRSDASDRKRSTRKRIRL